MVPPFWETPKSGNPWDHGFGFQLWLMFRITPGPLGSSTHMGGTAPRRNGATALRCAMPEQ